MDYKSRLTNPPKCNRTYMENDPENACLWDDKPKAWKRCFVVYRKDHCGDTLKDIAKQLGHAGSGDMYVNYDMICCTGTNKNGNKIYKYVKLSPQYVDKWTEIALKELTKIHGDEEYAKSLLP